MKGWAGKTGFAYCLRRRPARYAPATHAPAIIAVASAMPAAAPLERPPDDVLGSGSSEGSGVGGGGTTGGSVGAMLVPAGAIVGGNVTAVGVGGGAGVAVACGVAVGALAGRAVAVGASAGVAVAAGLGVGVKVAVGRAVGVGVAGGEPSVISTAMPSQAEGELQFMDATAWYWGLNSERLTSSTPTTSVPTRVNPGPALAVEAGLAPRINAAATAPLLPGSAKVSVPVVVSAPWEVVPTTWATLVAE